MSRVSLSLLLMLGACSQPLTRFLVDAGSDDGGMSDGGTGDGGMGDGGTSDGGMGDGGMGDGGTGDGGMSDGGTGDGGTGDGGTGDGGTDAGCPNDVMNCSGCGRACAVPVNAAARCFDGGCGRGPCIAGAFDLDPAIFGCESTCTAATCMVGDGGTVVFTAPPVPETGLVNEALSSGSSHGAAVQTSTGHTNFGILGEETPPGVEQTSVSHRHLGGFNSALRR